MVWKTCTVSIIVLSVIWEANCEEQLCPPPSMVAPCQCRYNGSMTVVTCDGVGNPQDIEDLTQRIPNWLVRLLKFTDCTMMFLPSAMLEDAFFSHMEVEDTRLQALFDSVPGNPGRLDSLTLKNVQVIQGYDWNMLSKTNLRTLRVSDVSLPVIDERFQRIYSKDLTDLELVNTKTKKVLNQTFSELKRLRYFALTHSLLKNITRDVFPSPWSSILSINLESNKLESLPIGLFDDMSLLKRVYLEDNLITTVPRELMTTGLRRTRLFHFGKGNKIFCDCSMKWLDQPATSGIMIVGECQGPQEMKGRSFSSLRGAFAYCQ